MVRMKVFIVDRREHPEASGRVQNSERKTDYGQLSVRRERKDRE